MAAKLTRVTHIIAIQLYQSGNFRVQPRMSMMYAHKEFRMARPSRFLVMDVSITWRTFRSLLQ